jgi:S-adenosyl-L-methionine hydrolase (adenosine-forming)
VLPAMRELGVPLAEAERPAGEGAAAVVVHIDAFGNLITSLPGDLLARDGRLALHRSHGRPPLNLRVGLTYSEVEPGELVAYVGSAGLVEIALREGSAAQVTGLQRGDHLRLERRTS